VLSFLPVFFCSYPRGRGDPVFFCSVIQHLKMVRRGRNM
jgi:hypothetical protein